ncbi:MAG: hypothetical protein HQL52_17515, partial [Magnetococcales bacterium]|nr:hypothetical protein [Magnetococcales bacterium]
MENAVTPVIPLDPDHTVDAGTPSVNACDLYAFLEVGNERLQNIVQGRGTIAELIFQM